MTSCPPLRLRRRPRAKGKKNGTKRKTFVESEDEADGGAGAEDKEDIHLASLPPLACVLASLGCSPSHSRPQTTFLHTVTALSHQCNTLRFSAYSPDRYHAESGVISEIIDSVGEDDHTRRASRQSRRRLAFRNQATHPTSPQRSSACSTSPLCMLKHCRSTLIIEEFDFNDKHDKHHYAILLYEVDSENEVEDISPGRCWLTHARSLPANSLSFARHLSIEFGLYTAETALTLFPELPPIFQSSPPSRWRRLRAWTACPQRGVVPQPAAA
ncbi:hypothetical protein HGRIS_005433 [Hohenbuehelia grisea]|uniref:Uncharacterized protein n=1 Tax=Hohenbuehelia grisea TaxID=104357 RepID=A0ABR3JZ32_9AGAR